uniref:Homeobox domain-containing protein n=1 Tax=Syphacia muris TaxID=451379 RepID=A0A158R627_9BILA
MFIKFYYEIYLRQLPGLSESFCVENERQTQVSTNEKTPRNGLAFRKMLETYDSVEASLILNTDFPGYDVVMQFNEGAEERKRKLDSLTEQEVPEVCAVECSSCNKTFSSIWVLKAHYEEVHNSTVPSKDVEQFAEKLRNFLDEMEEKENSNEEETNTEQNKKRRRDDSSVERDTVSRNSEDRFKPDAKRIKEEARECLVGSTSSTPLPSTSKDIPDFSSQLAVMGMMGFPFIGAPFMPVMGPEFFSNPLLATQPATGGLSHAVPSNSSTKRARTRITDDQLKVLRQYFDINNSPSEEQIKEMSMKTGLMEKVIKHWFRNTLFKERQRDKDSPYNFNVPPQMSIDLATYEKTGEAKITSLKTETLTEESKQTQAKSQNEEESTTTAANVTSPVVPNSLQLQQNQMSNAIASQIAAFLNDDRGLSTLPSGMTTPSSNSGRRANRTRFTDYQLKTLQLFFEKQPYPKDDDLEVLSKKLQLSPRVIVVWFQNARQKARKIYENQPSSAGDDRFLKTPGSNFQCKRCQLVFQRYYELIQHQQKSCYKDDGAAQQRDNKAVEENLSEDEKNCEGDSTNLSWLTAQPSGSQNADLTNVLAQLVGAANADSNADMKQAEFLKLLTGGSLPQDPSVTYVKKMREKKKAFYKRCPFCCLLFHSRESLVNHIPERHREQANNIPVDVDNLPDAEDVPTITAVANEDSSAAETSKVNGTQKKSDLSPLDLSCSNNTESREDSVSMSPSYYHSDNDDNSDNVETCDQYNSSSPTGMSVSSNGMQRSPANSKRYRTHLTPLQVHVMKNVFSEYKTPSMTECETLGVEIGLHKRVVQVWFQNARAKERKTRAYNGKTDEDLQRSTATRCALCSVEYSHRLNLHDHIFTSGHLAKVKKLFRNDSSRLDSSFGSENIIDKAENKTRARNLKDRSATKSANVNLPNPTSSPLTQFPYNLVYGLQPSLAPLMCDPNVVGTPIYLLQIPEAVMTQITADMAAGRGSTKFTQDGKTFQQLISVLPIKDFQCAGSKDIEVGWACPSCNTVFQQEVLLKSHQRLLCNSDSVFKLIQTHYECRACSTKLGTQSEFKSHCATAEHQAARENFLGANSIFRGQVQLIM